MKTNIYNLINENPNGLLELKPALSIPEYRDKYGFGFKNIWTIFESKKRHHSGNDWYAFKTNQTLEGLFAVKAESDGDLLIVFIVEVIKNNKIHCYLVLKDEAYAEILKDKAQYVLCVHQMYSNWGGNDYIALNMAS